MNRFGWFVLNVALVAALCAVGLLLGESDPSAHWRKVEEGILASAKPAETVPETADKPDPTIASRIERYPMDSKTADTLWQHTLFNPDRTEDIAIKAEAEAAKDAKDPDYTFEVRGIMMINDERVVNLSVKQPSRPRPVPHVVRGRRPGVVVRPGTASPPAEKPKKTTHVYREGDAVEDTGYVVAEITMETVALKRGDEELVLSVDLNDEMSQQRRDSAAEAEAAKAPPTKEEPAPPGSSPAAKPTGKAGSPPPPPPAPGVLMAPASTGGNATLEERLRSIRERQEKLRKETEKRRTPK
jgi:hypothetical protein